MAQKSYLQNSQDEKVAKNTRRQLKLLNALRIVRSWLMESLLSTGHEGGFKPFESQFSKERNILMMKLGEQINYFSQDTNGDSFLLKSWIKLGSTFFFGRLSDDGLYQATWDGNHPYENMDNGSYEIQIRKIKYLNE